MGGTATHPQIRDVHRLIRNGDRLSRTLNGTTWKYLYNKEDILRSDQAGTPMYFTQGPGIDDVLAESKSGAVKYAYKNMLSSVTTLADAGGLVTNAYQYDAWGNATNWPNPATDPNPYGYTGREWDVLNSYYYRARLYKSIMARFGTTDPLALIPTYVYVGNNPIQYTDPLGLQHSSAKKNAPTWPRRSQVETCNKPSAKKLICKQKQANCLANCQLYYPQQFKFNPTWMAEACVQFCDDAYDDCMNCKSDKGICDTQDQKGLCRDNCLWGPFPGGSSIPKVN